jgi:prepilin-type N-terminal cleavage/methylation domain-containing protein
VRRRDGFTLLEVMVAIFVLGLVVGALLQMMQGLLARLADARHELDAARLAELRMRELQAGAAEGILPEIGSTQGEFDSPYDYLRWQLLVEETAVPLPDDLAGGPPTSSIFALGGPASGEENRSEPSLLRISLRAFPDQTRDPQRFEPYVLYLVQPVNENLLEALSLREERAAREQQAARRRRRQEEE